LARSQRAAEAGTIETVVDAMQAHPQEADVQEWGCKALVHVCYGNNAEALAHKRRASRAGGRTATAAAMQAHPRHNELQQFGQWLLEMFI